MPTRVVNDKVYDGTISFEADDISSPVVGANLEFAPVYPSEISRAAIPQEDSSGYSLTANSKIAAFSQNVSNLKGGKQYRATAIARDQYGRESEQTGLEIPYIREFESIVGDAKFDVSASYMPWDFGPDTQNWKKELPLMGAYNSVWDIVKRKHIDWANGHGVNAFLVDIGEWNIPDQSQRRKVLSGLLQAGMKTGILWGPWETNYLRGTSTQAPDWSVDLTEPRNHDAFLSIGRSLIASGFFSHPSYYRVRGRPVIFLYDAVALVNEGDAFEQLRETLRTSQGTEPFLIGDLALRLPESPSESDWYLKWKHLSSYDAITSWAGFIKWPIKEAEYVNNYELHYERSLSDWRDFARKHGLNFVPTVIPGFDNTYSRGPKDSLTYPRSLEKFGERLAIASKYVDESKLLRIDTWNDFGEWTYIEPSDKTGFDYLLALKNEVT
jgi:hypothetical protein